MPAYIGWAQPIRYCQFSTLIKKQAKGMCYPQVGCVPIGIFGDGAGGSDPKFDPITMV